MSALAMLRYSRTLARMVLAAFVLTMTCAIAAPVLNPHTTALICTASGEVKLVSLGGEQGDQASAGMHHSLDCALCLAAGAPPPKVSAELPFQAVPSRILTGYSEYAVCRHTATPPPARGPPFSF